jgi:hypothetical protein
MQRLSILVMVWLTVFHRNLPLKRSKKCRVLKPQGSSMKNMIIPKTKSSCLPEVNFPPKMQIAVATANAIKLTKSLSDSC